METNRRRFLGMLATGLGAGAIGSTLGVAASKALVPETKCAPPPPRIRHQQRYMAEFGANAHTWDLRVADRHWEYTHLFVPEMPADVIERVGGDARVLLLRQAKRHFS